MSENGYWTYNGEGHYETLEEMWEYIVENEYYMDDVDIERYIDDNYTGAGMFYAIKEAGSYEALLEEIIEGYESENWYPEAQATPTEGEDYDYNGFTFEWVDEDEDEEAEDNE